LCAISPKLYDFAMPAFPVESKGSDGSVVADAPAIPLAQLESTRLVTNWPVTYGVGLLLSIRGCKYLEWEQERKVLLERHEKDRRDKPWKKMNSSHKKLMFSSFCP
jgi:hypothetical protein